MGFFVFLACAAINSAINFWRVYVVASTAVRIDKVTVA
jgi:hypothetical protein